jgi:hypothetical protein
MASALPEVQRYRQRKLSLSLNGAVLGENRWIKTVSETFLRHFIGNVNCLAWPDPSRPAGNQLARIKIIYKYQRMGCKHYKPSSHIAVSALLKAVFCLMSESELMGIQKTARPTAHILPLIELPTYDEAFDPSSDDYTTDLVHSLSSYFQNNSKSPQQVYKWRTISTTCLKIFA